jgi:two-component system, NarL family, response regulator NreC
VSRHVLKDSPAPQLVAAVREVFRGASYLSPCMLSQLVDDFRGRTKGGARQPRFATLTDGRLVLKKSPNG